MQVIKRDGRKVKFDKTKIIDAVLKAFKQVDGRVDDYATEKANKIAEYVKTKIEDRELTVEEIQDMVEQGLMSTKRKDVARAYITYREERNKIRLNKTRLMSQVTEKIRAKNVQNQNANMDEFSFGGRKFEAAGVMMKEIALNDIISPDVAKAYKENRIYIHDMDNYATGMHNCLLVDIAKLFKDGFVTRNGDVRPPKSISTAMQQVAVILQCQSQVQKRLA